MLTAGTTADDQSKYDICQKFPLDFSSVAKALAEAQESGTLQKQTNNALVENNYNLFGINGFEDESAGGSSSWIYRLFQRGESMLPSWMNINLEALEPLRLEDSAPAEATDYSWTPEETSEAEKCSFDMWRESPWNSNSVDNKPKMSFWPSPKIFCSVDHSVQYIGNIYFYLEGELEWNMQTTLKISVLDPLHRALPVRICQENIPSSRRQVCIFLALFPGIYTATVGDSLLNSHIDGSPLAISVSRNYDMLSARSLKFFSRTLKAWGVAYCTVNDRIYVTDREGHRVIIYHADGALDKFFGKEGNNQGEFYRPTGITVDNSYQRVVITDKDNHRVCVYSLEGTFIFGFGTNGFKNGEFSYPWGVAVSSKDSTIAIADSRNHRVQLFDSNGLFLRKFSVFESNPFEYKTEFNYPRGVAFDINGEDLYVTDFNIQAVFKLNSELTQKTKLTLRGACFKRPHGIVVDPVGNILVCDSNNNCIRVMSPKGELIKSISGATGEAFSLPQDIAITPSGEIIVVDADSKVRVM